MEWVRLEGPFAVGAEVTMKPKGQDPITSVIVEAAPNRVYTDETTAGRRHAEVQPHAGTAPP
jgi:hypothetical protein